jgi:hypothetical protein
LPFDPNRTLPDLTRCLLPNAAIAWKQPNGFFYPPAFHSTNLFFDEVDIRHYVIVPTFKPGTLDVDPDAVRGNYCTYPTSPTDPGEPGKLFSASFTDVDRQTELNDDDGSLSGLSGANPIQIDGNGTISVNRDEFFNAPKQVLECKSEDTCFQSPYDYVTAVIFPGCASAEGTGCDNSTTKAKPWASDCTSRSCYGVPLQRQYLTVNENMDDNQSIRMVGTAIFQRSTLVANNGEYYIDTAVSKEQQEQTPNHNIFEASQKYNFFLIYAKPTTSVTFKLYVGTGFDPNTILNKVNLIRAGTQREMPNGPVVLVTPLDFATQPSWPIGWQPS